jgi:hypothetical protein
LLRKPLAVASGGAGHLGVDRYGRDIYRTAEDSGYLALARWVYTSTTPAQPPMSMQPSGSGSGGTSGGGSGGTHPTTSGSGGSPPTGQPHSGDEDAGTERDAGSGEPATKPDSGMPAPDAGTPEPSNPYGACATASDCGAGARCIITANFPVDASVCAPACVETSDCPVPRGSYGAVLSCVTGYCQLDCTPVLFAPLLSCPSGMSCVAPLIGESYCHDDGS